MAAVPTAAGVDNAS